MKEGNRKEIAIDIETELKFFGKLGILVVPAISTSIC